MRESVCVVQRQHEIINFAPFNRQKSSKSDSIGYGQVVLDWAQSWLSEDCDRIFLEPMDERLEEVIHLNFQVRTRSSRHYFFLCVCVDDLQIMLGLKNMIFSLCWITGCKGKRVDVSA